MQSKALLHEDLLVRSLALPIQMRRWEPSMNAGVFTSGGTGQITPSP